jgi:hypothetical protein
MVLRMIKICKLRNFIKILNRIKKNLRISLVSYTNELLKDLRSNISLINITRFLGRPIKLLGIVNKI